MSKISQPREDVSDSRPGKRSMSYCVSLSQCSKRLNMTPLHPDPALQDKRKGARRGEGERMLGSDPSRPCQLFLTSPEAPRRLILTNYILH